MIYPVREVRDVILAQLDCQVFTTVSIEAFPFLNRFEINEPNWKQLAAIFFLLDFPGSPDFSYYPFTFHTVLRENKQELVVNLNRAENLLVKFPATLHVLRCKP